MSGFHRFKAFGRRIFSYYDSYPMTANTIVGGSVYAISETVSQVQNNKDQKTPFLDKINARRIAEIGILGSIENGIFMSAWSNIYYILYTIYIVTNSLKIIF